MPYLMTYSAKAIANTLLLIAQRHDKKLSPLQLQKLLYFAHGWFLALYKRPLINEEIQAWKYGPVISSIYHEFKKYGDQPIEGFAIEFEDGKYYTPLVPESDQDTRKLLEKIWNVYGKFSARELSTLSHEIGSPWDKTWKTNTYKLDSVAIKNEEIEKHFQLLSKNK